MFSFNKNSLLHVHFHNSLILVLRIITITRKTMKIIHFVVILSRTHFAFIFPLLLTFVHLFNCYPTNVRPEYITNIKDGSKLGLCDEDPTKYSSSHTLCTKTNEKGNNLNKFNRHRVIHCTVFIKTN